MNKAKIVKTKNATTRSKKLFSSWLIKPSDLKSARSNAERGNPQSYYEICEDMKTIDGHLGGELQTRKDALLGIPFEIVGDDERQKKVFGKCLEKTGYYSLLEAILDSAYPGFRVIDLDRWEVIDGALMPTHFDPIDNFYFRSATAEEVKESAYSLRDVLMYEKLPGQWSPLRNMEEDFLIADYTSLSMKRLPLNFMRMGLAPACVFLSLVKHYNIQDWSSLNELFATPGRIGTYTPDASPEDIDVLEEAIRDWGQDAAAVIPESTKIDIKNVDIGASISTFESLEIRCDKRQSMILLGQTGTADLKDAGAYAALRVLNGVRIEKVVSDARFAERFFKEEFIPAVMAQNFTEIDPTLAIKIQVPNMDDIEKLMRVARDAYDMGLPLSRSDIREKTGLKEPADEKDGLVKTAGVLGSVFGRI